MSEKKRNEKKIRTLGIEEITRENYKRGTISTCVRFYVRTYIINVNYSSVSGMKSTCGFDEVKFSY